MTEIKNGLVLTQSKLLNGNFTYGGKPLEFKQDENNPLLYTAQTSLTDKEKKAGNRDWAFTINFGEAEGTITTSLLPPMLENDPDFKDLTDSEKLTKLNSIAYQFGAEPTDVGAGLDEVLQKSVKVPPQNENFAENKQSQNQQQKQEGQQQPSTRKKDEEDKVNLADIKKIEETHSSKNKTAVEK